MTAKVSFRRSQLCLHSSVFLCSEYSFQNPSLAFVFLSVWINETALSQGLSRTLTWSFCYRYKLNNLPLNDNLQRVLLMFLAFLPQEEVFLVTGGFTRVCQVQMKYRAVTLKEIEFHNSIRHLSCVHCVKQFLWSLHPESDKTKC